MLEIFGDNGSTQDMGLRIAAVVPKPLSSSVIVSGSGNRFLKVVDLKKAGQVTNLMWSNPRAHNGQRSHWDNGMRKNEHWNDPSCRQLTDINRIHARSESQATPIVTSRSFATCAMPTEWPGASPRRPRNPTSSVFRTSSGSCHPCPCASSKRGFHV